MDSGARFKRLMRGNYYPWEPSEDRTVKTDALYDLTRNPLAHALGVLEPGQTAVSCEKTSEGLTPAQISALDVAYDGQRLPPALEMEMLGGVWHLNVPYLYAAVLEMFPFARNFLLESAVARPVATRRFT